MSNTPSSGASISTRAAISSAMPSVAGNWTALWNSTVSTIPTLSTAGWNVSNTTTAYSHQDDQKDYYIGLVLAVLSSLFIGTSYILKKLGLMRAAKLTNVHASEGSISYLRDWVWWLGMSLMGIGEIANFVAYGFAPATLVTPLGALSVIVSSILSSKFLHETLNIFGQSGCLLCVVGSTMIVLNAPQERTITSMYELAPMLYDPGFLVYVILILGGNLVLVFYCVPRWGKTNPFVYITITGSMGSLTVVSCKSVGVALLQLFAGQVEVLAFWLTWFVLVVAGACIALQMNFLNRALDAFNTAVVSTILYIIFTTFVLIASALLFKEWGSLSVPAIINIMCGFVVIVVAVFLISMFKELKLGWRNLIDFVFLHKPEAFQNVGANIPTLNSESPTRNESAASVSAIRLPKVGFLNKNKRRRLSESISDTEEPTEGPAEPPATGNSNLPSNGAQNGSFLNLGFADDSLALDLPSTEPFNVGFAGTVTTDGIMGQPTITTRAIVEAPVTNEASPAANPVYTIETGMDLHATLNGNQSHGILDDNSEPYTVQLDDSSASRNLFLQQAPRNLTANGMSDPFANGHGRSPSTPGRMLHLDNAEDKTLNDRQTLPFPSYSSIGETEQRYSGQHYISRI